MFRKSLAVAVVVAVAIGTMQPSAAAARPVPSDGPVAGTAANDCAAATRDSSPVMRRAARTGKDRIVCISVKAPPGATGAAPKTHVRKRSNIRAAAVSCPPGSWDITRLEVCMTEVSDINIFRRICRNGVCVPTHVGSMEVSAKILSKTWPHQSNWDLQVELTALNATGEGLEGAYFDGVMGCEGSCITTRSNFPSQLLHVGNKISGYGTVRSTVGGAGMQATGRATMAMTVRGAASDLPGFHTVRVDPAARCDTIASTTVGCVFPDAGLVYGLPSWEYPDVARHVRLAQDSGLVGRNVPLHRLINEGREQNNRYIACNPSIPRPGGLDCDEYPFASTHEGAAMFGPGFGRTFPDCGRSDLSTVRTGPNGWSACLVPYFDNRGQGADLGRFYFLNRVLDGDDFYVEVD